MPVQMIELEEVQMVEISDDFLEAEVAGKGEGTFGSTFFNVSNFC